MSNLSWRVGDIIITKLVEAEIVAPFGAAYSAVPQGTPEQLRDIPWLMPDFVTADGDARLSVHALLVDAPSGRIVVDTCIGNDKPRAVATFDRLKTRFLADLEAAGWDRERVDGVRCTHLHVDHVGWNTMLVEDRWVPTFPNARYFMGREEFAHWEQDMSAPMSQQIMADSVRPVLDAGLAELVETDAKIAPEIRLFATPGHTPGHVSVLIESRGERAVITGDLMHHPCQMAHPEWSSAFDTDQAQSRLTRHDFLARFADTPTLVIGTHFAGPTAGRVVRDGNAFRLDT